MTAKWVGEDRKAVTAVKVGGCRVIQTKNIDTDGYKAVQLGFGDKKLKNLAKPLVGHMKGLGSFKYLKEIRLDDKENSSLVAGDFIAADTFAPGDKVIVTGWSKGRGFAGVVKRHGFHGQDKTHGNKDQLRMPGSIGAGGVQRVFKGRRMAGHMGDAQITSHNIEIIEVDSENNILYLGGSVPGARHGLVILTAAGEVKVQENKKLEPVVEEIAPEEIKEEAVEEKIEEKAEEKSEA